MAAHICGATQKFPEKENTIETKVNVGCSQYMYFPEDLKGQFAGDNFNNYNYNQVKQQNDK